MTLYIEDCIVVTTHDTIVYVHKYSVLQTVINIFESKYEKRFGFHVHVRKCSVWWPSELSDDVKSANPSAVRQSHGGLTVIMQAPIGTDAFVIIHLHNELFKAKSLMYCIMKIEDAHVSFTLLRSCAGD